MAHLFRAGKYACTTFWVSCVSTAPFLAVLAVSKRVFMSRLFGDFLKRLAPVAKVVNSATPHPVFVFGGVAHLFKPLRFVFHRSEWNVFHALVVLSETLPAIGAFAEESKSVRKPSENPVSHRLKVHFLVLEMLTAPTAMPFPIWNHRVVPVPPALNSFHKSEWYVIARIWRRRILCHIPPRLRRLGRWLFGLRLAAHKLN